MRRLRRLVLALALAGTSCSAAVSSSRVPRVASPPAVAKPEPEAVAAPPSPPPAVAVAAIEPEAKPEPERVEPPAKPRFTITKGTRVLIFGDSMVTSGLGVYLGERIAARGGKLISISKGSSTTASWSEGRELQELIARARPDVVLVVLASNELFVPNPRARRYAIRSIVERIGARPCLWIGPSPWLPEKGIIGVVREASSPCRFYDSTPLTLERQADHIHPTLQGGKDWADAVWQDAFED